MHDLLGAWLGALLLLAGQEGTRVPVPDIEPQRTAEKLIREVFSAEYAKTTPSDKASLAGILLKQAGDTKDDPAARYVLLREARDLASQGGDLQVTIAAVDSLAKHFALDRIGTMETALKSVASQLRTTEQHRELALAYLALCDEAAASGDSEAALRISAAGVTAAKKAKDVSLATRTESKTKALAELRSRSAAAKRAEETLASKPDDPAAHSVLGEFYCLVKGDWEKGLGHLAKGADSPLKAAALRDLENPKEASGQARAGDGWWDLAIGADGGWREPFRRRAGFWYGQCCAELKGLAKLRVEKRLEEINADSSSPNAAVSPSSSPSANPGALHEKLSAITRRLKAADSPSESGAVLGELQSLSEEAVAADDYEFALKVLAIADAASKKAGTTSIGEAIQAKVVEVKAIQREWIKVRAALKTLETGPNDEKANLAAGIFYSTMKGDWGRGVAHLRKGSDAALRELAALDAQPPAEPQEKVKLAERWIERAKQSPRFKDRGIHWYKEAWPGLARADRDKIRPRVAELQALVLPQDKEWTPVSNIPGWSFNSGSGIGHKYAHSGKASARIAPSSGKRSFVMMERMASNPGKEFTLSFYVLSEGDLAATAAVYWYRAGDGGNMGGQKAAIPSDFPFWQRVELKATMPQDSGKTALDLAINSATGTVWVDDISLLVDGRELIRNAGFEDR